MKRRALLVACLLVAVVGHAETFSGRVVGVTDGDTVTVLATGNVQERIRVMGIDAPEKRQPFGQVSRQSLADLVFDRSVVIEWKKRDRYRRIVGRVLVGGRDAGLEQVRRGLAWHYRKYESEQSPDDRIRYGEAESSARSAHRGLWQDKDPTPPWDWRRRGRE